MLGDCTFYTIFKDAFANLFNADAVFISLNLCFPLNEKYHTDGLVILGIKNCRFSLMRVNWTSARDYDCTIFAGHPIIWKKSDPCLEVFLRRNS